VRTCGASDLSRVRLVRIANTLHLGDLWISEALVDEARANPAITVLGEPEPMRLDEDTDRAGPHLDPLPPRGRGGRDEGVL
jgi:hypothetical protein